MLLRWWNIGFVLHLFFEWSKLPAATPRLVTLDNSIRKTGSALYQIVWHQQCVRNKLEQLMQASSDVTRAIFSYIDKKKDFVVDSTKLYLHWRTNNIHEFLTLYAYGLYYQISCFTYITIIPFQYFDSKLNCKKLISFASFPHILPGVSKL